MTPKLPINLDSLLHQRTVESERIEYKAGWNPESILHSFCAFANDFHNLGGETRPYKARVRLGEKKADWAFYIRKHTSTVRAKGPDEQELLSLAATVPFDDRYRQTASLDDLSPRLIREFLREIGSELAAEASALEIREPIEIRITPEELVVLSFPGPDRSIRLKDLQAGRAVSRRYRNRRIGEFLKELDLTEGRSTGVPKILRVMQTNGSPAPVFESDDERSSFLIRLPVHEGFAEAVTGEVTGEVQRLMSVMQGEMKRTDIQAALGLKHEDHFREVYLRPALDDGYVEMTIPDKPRSRLQKYRLTGQGKRWLAGNR